MGLDRKPVADEGRDGVARRALRQFAHAAQELDEAEGVALTRRPLLLVGLHEAQRAEAGLDAELLRQPRLFGELVGPVLFGGADVEVLEHPRLLRRPQLADDVGDLLRRVAALEELVVELLEWIHAWPPRMRSRIACVAGSTGTGAGLKVMGTVWIGCGAKA